MSNHDSEKKRPTYFTIKDKDLLWFIPLSSKVENYKAIIDKKINKYGLCNTILIRKIANKDTVILLQNAFPTLEKYIDHVHMVNGAPYRVADNLKKEILKYFTSLMRMKEQKGINLFFADVDRIKRTMLEETKELEPTG